MLWLPKHGEAASPAETQTAPGCKGFHLAATLRRFTAMAAKLEEEEEALRVFVHEWREILRKEEEKEIEEFLNSAHKDLSEWPPLLGSAQDGQEATFEPHDLVHDLATDANTATTCTPTCTPQSTSPTAERPERPERPESHTEPVQEAMKVQTREGSPQQLAEPTVVEPTTAAPTTAAPTTAAPTTAAPTTAEPTVAEPAAVEPAVAEAPSPEPTKCTEPAEPEPRPCMEQPKVEENESISGMPNTKDVATPSAVGSEGAAEAEKAEPPAPAAAEPPAAAAPAAAAPAAAAAEPAPEKPQVDHEAVKAAAKRAAEILSGLTKPLEYEVREAVPVHESPDPNSKSFRVLSPGQMVHGYPGSGWLRLQPGSSTSGWVHIGRSLAVQCLLPTVRARYLEGVDVAWPGFKGLLKPDVKVVYIVEWRCKKSGAAGHAVCHKPQEVVSNMPPGKPFELHVAVRIRGPTTPGADSPPEVRFAGPWIESQTLQIKTEDEEDADSCLDPFGTSRAGCLNCQCYGFIWRPGLEEQEEEDPDAAQRLGLNADPESIKCMRCGDPFDSHARSGTPAATRLLESRPLRKYLVVHPRIFVRSQRSTSGDALGALRRGTEVAGCCEGNWLHLSQECARAMNAMPRGGSVSSKAKYVDAWVLIDGASVGFQSDLLVPEELAPADLREQIQQEEEERQRKAAEAAKRQEARLDTKKAQAKNSKESKDSKKPVEPDSEDEAGT